MAVVPALASQVFLARGSSVSCGMLDTWHFFLRPEGVEWDALEELPESVFANVQLSDGVAYGEGEFGVATMDRRRLPGEGGFDLRECAVKSQV